MNYLEKLRDPRWQKRRLETLSRFRWQCQGCGGHEQTLHIDHLVYRSGASPWDYDDDELTVFCATCHEAIHDAKRRYDAVFRGVLECCGIHALCQVVADIELEHLGRG